MSKESTSITSSKATSGIGKVKSDIPTTADAKSPRKLGFFGLLALVIGSMIAGGIFNVPGDIAQTSGPLAAIIAWGITGVGVFFLAMTFRTLSLEKPEITGGIYYYARDGFGSYVGFNSGWGYWISNAIGNVSFVILLLDTVHSLFPSFGGAKSILGFIIGTILIWGVVLLVSFGVHNASVINTIATIGKLIPILVGALLVVLHFKYHIFEINWQETTSHAMLQKGGLGSVWTQVKGAMLQTMWVFIGIEGAVVISGRAKSQKAVGKATTVGYFFTLIVYLLISIFAYGLTTQAKLAGMDDPSLAGILKESVGDWGAWMVDIGVLISVAGAWISWTILTAEIPFLAARDKMFPKFIAKSNKHEAPVSALILNGVIMQVTFVLSLFAANAFEAITNNASALVLLPYGLSCAYMLKVGIQKKQAKGYFIGIVGILYSAYMFYASGWTTIMWFFVLYALGFVFWLWDKKAYQWQTFFENTRDKIFFWCLSAVGLISFVILISQML